VLNVPPAKVINLFGKYYIGLDRVSFKFHSSSIIHHPSSISQPTNAAIAADYSAQTL